MEDWIIDPIGEEMRRMKRETDALKAMGNPVSLIDRTLVDAVRMSNTAEEAMRTAAALSPTELLGIAALREEEPARINLDLLIDPKTKVLFDISAKLDEMNESTKELINEFVKNNYTMTEFLTALEEVIESKEMPEPHKKTIIQKIRDFKNDPIISSASGTLLAEAMLKVFGG